MTQIMATLSLISYPIKENIFTPIYTTHTLSYIQIVLIKHLFRILCYYFCYEARELGAARERDTHENPPLKAFHVSLPAHTTKWGCLGCIQIIINTLLKLNRVISGVVLTQLQQASSSTSQQVPLNYSSHRKQTPHKRERAFLFFLKLKLFFFI